MGRRMRWQPRGGPATFFSTHLSQLGSAWGNLGLIKLSYKPQHSTDLMFHKPPETAVKLYLKSTYFAQWGEMSPGTWFLKETWTHGIALCRKVKSIHWREFWKKVTSSKWEQTNSFLKDSRNYELIFYLFFKYEGDEHVLTIKDSANG